MPPGVSTPVTKIQFAGTLILGAATLGFSLAVWFLFVWPAAHSVAFINLVLLVLGSVMCILLGALGVKMKKRLCRAARATQLTALLGIRTLIGPYCARFCA